jgi:hypothetical protein
VKKWVNSVSYVFKTSGAIQVSYINLAHTQLHRFSGVRKCVLPVCFFFFYIACATAQDQADLSRQLEELQLQLVEVQQESQAKLQALQEETAAQIGLIQEQIALIRGQAVENDASVPTTQVMLSQSPKPAEVTPAQVTTASPSPLDHLHLNGDFRLRYEANSADDPLPSWDRWVLRGRFAARYDLTDDLALGARLATGDPDNPRTTDVTLSDFAGDLDVSLDQAYFAYNGTNSMLTGGKFAKPFSSTELVWDGDVNPQGLGGYFNFLTRDNWSLRFSGLYFVVNENTLADSSDMLGGQMSLDFQSASDWTTSIHLGYFDYEMGLLDPSLPGGSRGNTVTPEGTHYISDFNLLDASGTITYGGFGNRWKLWLTSDYVKNLGAEIPQDSGYGADLFAGSLAGKGHWLLRYGYAQTGTDAVLGLYSHDNIVYPTNYRMHTISADYALSENAFVGLTNYFYKQLDPDPLSPFDNDWVSRTRLNLYFVY